MPTTGFDFTRYRPPGVYTEAIGGPQLGVNSSAPTAPGIFGMAIGYQNFIESITINADLDEETPAVNRTLAKPGVIVDSVEVRNPNSGQIYVEGADYVIVRVSAGPDATTDTRDDLYAISRVIDGGHIHVGDVVQVRYRFTDPEYFQPQTFFDYDDVRDWYGEPFDEAGNIQSELTLAAKFAFGNGAYRVVCVAVDAADPSSPTTGEYYDALRKLEDHADVAIVVPATGIQEIQELVAQHVTAQSENRHERCAIVGRDGSVNNISYSQRIIDAQALSNQRVAVVAPSSFKYYSPEINKEITLGAQYMAAALAGIALRLNPAVPLTRKRIHGFRDVGEVEPDGQKDLETQNGLMVIEKTRSQIMWVRHGVTSDPTDLLTREWNIIRQADAMVFRLRDYLENDDLIGQPILDYTLLNVKASAESALQSLVRDGIIQDYVGLKVRQLQTNPDVLEVSYSWKPAFPLNYIVVRYAVTLTTGDITTNAGSVLTNDVSNLQFPNTGTISST